MIQSKSVRVIDENGEQKGVIPTVDAIRLAQGKKGWILSSFRPAADPPVCKNT